MQGLPAFVQTVLPTLPPQVIAAMARRCAGLEDRWRGKSALPLVSSRASASRLVLALVEVEDQFHEIAALPELLRQVALRGCVVTMDAMG